MSTAALPQLRASLADGAYGAWRLTRSTGKAAWIAVSSFLILVVPLIIELDREQQLVEFEAQQLGALTGGAGQTGGGPPAATKYKKKKKKKKKTASPDCICFCAFRAPDPRTRARPDHHIEI